MSLPKQIKSVRCWMSKRSSRSLTDTGYDITLESNLKAYHDYHIRSIINKSKPIRGNSGDGMLTEDCSTVHHVMDQQFTLGMQDLRNFKEINSNLERRRKDGLQSDISWTHHLADDENLDKCHEKRPYNNLVSPDVQAYEGYFYGCKHWNFYCIDDDIGAVIVSLKEETVHGIEYIRIVVRSSLRSLHVVASPSLLGIYEQYSDPFSWIDTLTPLLQLTKPLQVINHYTAGIKLVKLDRVFVKSDFKIGVLYVKHGQQTEEEIFSNISHSNAFDSFLRLLGDRVDLRSFQGYSGGLDTCNGLNGTQSIYTEHRNNNIMFHVPTLMPNTGEDNKYLGKKRHVGNDVLCVLFTDQTDTLFSPLWIKSQFIYAYILVQVLSSSKDHLKFKVSIVSRQEVPWFGPPLPQDGTFEEGDAFREWLLEKIVNGDRACYKAPKFASVQERTRSQIMKNILKKETDMDERHSPSATPSPRNSLESLEDLFPDDSIDIFDHANPKLKYFYSSQEGINFGDVAFLAGKTDKKRIYGVRSVMCRKSRVFRDMLTDWVLPIDFIPSNSKLKDDSLVKLALKKARTQSMIHSSSKKGKFAIDTSLETSPSLNEYVTTTSIKQGGQTYEISLDCIGRTREFLINEFEADTFSDVIEYMHNGNCTITYETLPGLLCAATYYELPDLRASCLNRRDDVITVKTVCRMLNIIEEYVYFKDGKELQEKLLQFFANNIEQISSCKELFSILTKNRIVLVLSQNWKSEEKLKVKVLILWAKSQDIHGWKKLAQSVITSCGHMDNITIDENCLNLTDD